MRSWFESLQPREKTFVSAAAVALVLAVFWLGVWMPLDRGQQNAARSVESWRTALAEFRSMKAELRAGAGARVPAALNQSLVVLVDGTLRSHNLYQALQSSTPLQDNGIRVNFRDAAFDDLVLWLGNVSDQYGLRAQSVEIRPSNDPGRVDGSVTLER